MDNFSPEEQQFLRQFGVVDVKVVDVKKRTMVLKITKAGGLYGVLETSNRSETRALCHLIAASVVESPPEVVRLVTDYEPAEPKVNRRASLRYGPAFPHRDKFVELGAFYDYPECCVDFFVKNRQNKPLNYPWTARSNGVWIRCDKCLKR